MIVEATIDVPESATISDVDVIVIRVTSQWDGAQNSAVVNAVVTSDIDDLIPPKFVVIDETSCSNQSESQYVCDLEKWFFEAVVFDLESGLGKVNFELNGDDYQSSIGDFVPGSMENISVSFEASCCIRRASMSIIDVVGNSAVKQFNQGPLRDCGRLSLSDLNAKGFDLTWTCPCADWPRIDHFSVSVLASDGIIDFADNYYSETCDKITQKIPGLRSCMGYNVTLMAHAGPEGIEHETETYREMATMTLESVPTRPTALTVTTKTTTTLNVTWMPPIEYKECVQHYRVCYKLLAYTKTLEENDEACIETENVEVLLEDLEPCAQYRIRITAFTAFGKQSLDAIIDETTELAVPGAPSNFTIIQMVSDTAIVAWNRPEVYPWCVKSYVIKFYPLSGGFFDSKTFDDTTTLEPEPTTKATEVTTKATEATTIPTEATTIPTEATTKPTEATTKPTEATTKATEATTKATEITETTTTTPEPTTTTENILDKFDFVDEVLHLEYCTEYNFTIWSDGYQDIGASTIVSQVALTDNTPTISGPSSVSVYDTTETSMTVTWYPPEDHFQCLIGYNVTWKSLIDESDQGELTVTKDTNDVLLDQLAPCSTYSIVVKALAEDNVYGNSKAIQASTLDEVPGAPIDLKIANITQTSFDAHWCPSRINPQCSATWRWLTEEDNGQTRFLQNGCQDLEEIVRNCGQTYQFTVWANSPLYGLEGERETVEFTTLAC